MALLETVPDTTRQRLLDAATLIFSERGYEAAAVRDICKHAQANVAAVNYHFGDKHRLYIETVKYAHRSCHEGVPFPDWPPGTPANVRLRDFVTTMVRRVWHEPYPAAMTILLREMIHPTDACAEWVREYIRPIADRLMSIMSELLPVGTPMLQAYLYGFSIVGQVLHYKQNRPVIQQLLGPNGFAALDAEMLAEHITRFSLTALGQPVPETTP